VAETARRPYEDPGSVEELLRYQAPSQYNVRWSLKDAAARGHDPGGQSSVSHQRVANRVATPWTDADKFDIDRDPNEAQKLGFGLRDHSCLGAGGWPAGKVQ